MILMHRGERPVIPASAYVAPSAVLCGAVTLGERTRVLHGAVVTAEDGEVWIGDDVVIMENALVRGRSRNPTSVGNAVLIGPHAHINGATVEDEVSLPPAHRCFPDRSPAAEWNCESTACSTSTPSWTRGQSCRSAGSRRAIQRNSSRPISTRNCGACRPSLTFPARFTECREAHLCDRS